MDSKIDSKRISELVVLKMNSIRVFSAFWAVISICLIIPLQEVYADPTEASLTGASNRYNQASQDYYRGIRALGPSATPEQINQLQARTIIPAGVNRMNVVSQIFAQRLASTVGNVHEILRKKMGLTKIGKPLATGTRSTQALPLASPAVQPKTERVLDGRGIPREVQFGKQPSKK